MISAEQSQSSRSKAKQQIIKTIVVKLVETILQMRVDVKKEQTDRFQTVVTELRKSKEPYEGTIEQFLATLLKKDLHSVSKQIFQTNKYHQEITIELSLVHKKTQFCEVFEIWKLTFDIEDTQMVSLFSKGSNEVNEIRYFFKEAIEELIQMPIWQKYWGDNINRKEVKLSHILNYKVKYQDVPLPFEFEFDDLRYFQKRFPSLKAKIRVFLKKEVCSLNTTITSPPQKKPSDKSGYIKGVSESSNGSNKKYSIYSYQEDDIDIVFISSDAEFSPSTQNIKQIQIMPVDEESDGEYVMLVEEEEDPKKRIFLDTLSKLSEKSKIFNKDLDQ